MKHLFSLYLMVLFIFAGCFLTTKIQSAHLSACRLFKNNYIAVKFPYISDNTSSDEVLELNSSLRLLLTIRDYEGCMPIIDTILGEAGKSSIDELVLAESYYLIGIFYYSTSPVRDAVTYFNMSIDLLEKNNENSKLYADALYNTGAVYERLGDFKRCEDYLRRALKVESEIFGMTSPSLIETYSSLISAYTELADYDEAIRLSNIALSIVKNNPDSVSSGTLADLYHNIGVSYYRVADFSKANMYFEESEKNFRNSNSNLDGNYINLLNSMAASYDALNLFDKSNEYYENGIALAIENNSARAFNNINSYSIFLGNNGRKEKGEALLKEALARAAKIYGENSNNYIEVLRNYADYLREYGFDINKSLDFFNDCMEYLGNNQQDLTLRASVLFGYSLSLSKSGNKNRALETIQLLLFSDDWKNQGVDVYDNPSVGTIKQDRRSLKILRTKYNILWDIYRSSPERKILEAACNTSELIVALLEKVRINISEEESRLILGDNYRDSYINTIRDFNLLYRQTSDFHFLEKAFEYSEKSKVAGLLASTRELKAVQFHIPPEIANLEKWLQRDISLVNAKITEESSNEVTDNTLIDNLKENLLQATRQRDSLVLELEKMYPEYYSIKYNTSVAGLKDIRNITGRNGNYVNYVVTDTLLYIFVVNRKHQVLSAVPVDSTFFNNIRSFRKLISSNPASEDLREPFIQYHLIGYEIFRKIFEPIEKYVISDNILISSDNILSYLPLEVLPTSPEFGERSSYRDIPYMMNFYNVSYTYSATLTTESGPGKSRFRNDLIAFAPLYPNIIDVQSVIMSRQASKEVLHDLPFARQEVENIKKITGGTIYINNNAKETIYKAESGKFDIIHLAMHTIMNDKDPMYSTLIFNSDADTINDGYLKTYEIYGIPLKAKMVVLSSCNTGTGLLSTGEGILSLARGFTYSGSQSVIMAMWEIEDRSGTEIVTKFYNNLKRGYSKSVALKKARSLFLRTAEPLKSHPYYWATLIVYGNNEPLYYSRYMAMFLLAVFFTVAGMIFYLLKRKYS